MIKQFQSHLIVGSPDKTRRETKSLAANLGIYLDKPSPDNFIITKEKDHLTIDQIRTLKKHIFQKPLKQTYKFVVLAEAESLTIEAQNSLLKILEEPPESAILVLETEEKRKLLPTILSRCAQIILTDAHNSQEEFSLLKKSLQESLEQLNEIENPKKWLNEQIKILYKRLLKNQETGKSTETIVKLIEICAQTKKMIEANVNPKFALAGLFLEASLAST